MKVLATLLSRLDGMTIIDIVYVYFSYMSSFICV
jgi:hypothetical protein